MAELRALRESCSDEKREHSDAIARIQTEWDRLQKRIDAMYVDKLDGRIDEGFYKRTRAQWRDEQERCERDIERHRAADDSYMDQGVQLLNLAQNAHQFFMAQPAKEHGTLAVEYREPLICWLKLSLPRRASKSSRARKWLKNRFGWGTRIRT